MLDGEALGILDVLRGSSFHRADYRIADHRERRRAWQIG